MKRNKVFRRAISIVLLIIISNSIDVFGGGMVSEPPHIKLLYKKNNIDELKDPKRFYYFMEIDKNYIEKVDNETLYREIAFLDQYIFDENQTFAKDNKDMIFYPPNSVGNILVCELASRNRRNLIESRKNGSDFIYESEVFRYPKKSIRMSISNTIDTNDLKIAYDEINNVVKSDVFGKNLLKNTIISLSPFKMRGLNAFTETYGLDGAGISIVLGVKNEGMTEEKFRESVRETLLHELGHVLHEKSLNENERFDLSNPFWQEYISYYKEEDLGFSYREKKTKANWRKDIRENLAEDFKIYYSDKLGKYSFDAGSKNTGIKYNPEVGKFFDKHISKTFEFTPVCINHSTVETPDKLLTLHRQGIIELENTNGLQVKVQTKKENHCEGSYIGIWEKGKDNLVEKVYINGNEDTIINIDKDSNISFLIKYEFINNKYEPIWKLNIK